MRPLLLFFCFIGFSARATDSLLLQVHTHHVLNIPGIRRVAVASRKIVSVKALPPSQVLLTGRHEGQTSITVWDASGERTFLVRVLLPEAFHAARAAESPLARVFLEFLELEQNFLSDLGMDWPSGLPFTLSGTAEGPPWGVNMGAAFGSVNVLLKTLVSEGWATLVAKPELYVRLGEEARFHAGGELPIAGTTGAYGNYYSRIAWKPFGLNVKVLPQRQSADRLHCDIDVEISEPGGDVLENVPGFSRRHVQTRVDLADGETILLSGLVRRNTNLNQSGLPVLSQIPLLGPLVFGGTRKKRRETEMMMALTISLVHRKAARSAFEALREKTDGPP